MIDLLGILLIIFLFHLFVWPFIKGFYDGYNDAKNNKPYNNKIEDGK